MKKCILSGLFLCVGALALYAQTLPSVRIVNNTGYSIYFIYASPAESDDWGEELLGEDILEDGDFIMVKLSHPLNITNVYDFGIQDEDGDLYFKWKVTVTNNARIVFTIDDLNAEEE
jgi:hypothetical protein